MQGLPVRDLPHLLPDGATAGAKAARILLDPAVQLQQHVPHGRDDHLAVDGLEQMALALAAEAEPLLLGLEADLNHPAPRIEPDDLLRCEAAVCADEGDELVGLAALRDEHQPHPAAGLGEGDHRQHFLLAHGGGSRRPGAEPLLARAPAALDLAEHHA